MVQRVNVSIPNVLFERLQKHKENMNVSQICQNALTEAIKMEEIKELNAPNRKDRIAKLKKQKEASDNTSRKQGFDAGVETANEDTVDYEFFMFVEKTSKSQLSEDIDALGQIHDHLEEKIISLRDDPTFNENMYVKGWIEGVMSIWEDLKNEMESEQS